MSNPALPPKTAKLIEVPEDALLELLRHSGQTLPDFLKLHQSSIQFGREFLKRANAAKWSRLWLACSALISLVSFLVERDLEDAIGAILLTAMTCVEFKVRNWFLNGDERGAIYGYWNQTAFSILFLIYGAYHCLTASVPEIDAQIVGAEYNAYILQFSRIFYGTVGIAGAVGQYFLALYYKRVLRR